MGYKHNSANSVSGRAAITDKCELLLTELVNAFKVLGYGKE